MIAGSLARARGQFGTLVTIEREEWSGGTFQMGALGQSAAGTITVMEDKVLIAVTLPWLLRQGGRAHPADHPKADYAVARK